MKKIKLNILLLLFIISASSFANIIYMTDFEGDASSFDSLVEHGKIKIDKNGKPVIVDPKTEIVFGGDLPDRRPDSIRLVEMMSALKEKYPERVTLIWGNREMNKLGLINDIEGLRSGSHPEYRAHLLSEIEKGEGKRLSRKRKDELIKKYNTPSRQASWWLSNQGAGDALKFHQEELSKKLGKNISIDEAAKDYIERMMPPDGTFFKYLRQGQIAAIKEGTFFVHGGLNQSNILRVPGDSKTYPNHQEWVSALNSWGDSQLEEVERLHRSGNSSKVSKLNLFRYGDAKWDPTVGKWGAVIASDQSVIYPIRSKNDGNLRLPDEATVRSLRQSGISQLVLGHTPAGNVAVPLTTNDGFTTLMADTSFSPQDQTKKFIEISPGGIRAEGLLADGTEILMETGKSGDPLIGKVVDGHTIVGKRKDGSYALYRYAPGYKIEEKFLTRAEVLALKPQAPIVVDNEEHKRLLETFTDGVSDEARAKDGRKPIKLYDDIWQMKLANIDRTPIIFSGASQFTDEFLDGDKVRATTRDLLLNLDPKKIVIVTGGTHHGFEKIVHEEAWKISPEFKIEGVASAGATPKDIPDINGVVVGGYDWDSPLKSAIGWAKESNGVVVTVGGGGVVKKGIAMADEVGANILVMGGDAIKKGASKEYSDLESFKSRTFTNGDELVNLVRGSSKETLLDSPSKELKIGFYTGSFDPPHSGHRNVVEQMQKRYGLDKVYVVPEKGSQYKPDIRPLEERKDMLRFTFADNPQIQVLPDSLEAKTGKGEIWDVADVIQANHPDARVHAIMGTDTYDWYATLGKDKQRQNVSLLINQRGGDTTERRKIRGITAEFADLNDEGLSSSLVRKMIARGEKVDSLDPKIAQYIQDNQLYEFKTAKPDEIIKDYNKSGKKVVTLVGFSGAGYEKPEEMIENVKKIFSRFDPNKTIINIGATTDGIGEAYRIAKEMGFETRGIVSVKAKKYGGLSPYLDKAFYVQDDSWGGLDKSTGRLTARSEAMVSVSDEIYAFGGGDVGKDELVEARSRGIHTEYYDMELNHEKATSKALKNGQPKPSNFRGAASVLRGIKPNCNFSKFVRDMQTSGL